MVSQRQRVVRRRLVELVDHVTAGQTVAISAPAGWGKSELLASWEEHRASSTATAWITLEPGDDVPRRFWQRFLSAVAGADWSAGNALGLMEVAPEGEVEGEQIVRAIVDRVPTQGAPLTLIIDDVHLLAGDGTSGASTASGNSAADLALLLRNLPASWQLVLSGRSLPLPLMRLRVAGLLTSVGRDELAFDDSEAGALFEDLGCRLSRSEIAQLVSCTGGWAAALRLTAMPLSRGVPVQEVVAGVLAGQHDVERYFHEEVVDSLPAHVAEFLVATSISPTLNVQLARYLTGQDEAGVLLQSLAESGIFTAADRSRTGSYRYHPLLAESLEGFLARSDPDRHQALHHAAAVWHQEHGQSDAAFHHAVVSESWQVCVEVIDDVWIPMFVGGDVEGLAELLTLLPRKLVSDNDGLRALRALVLLDQADVARVAAEAQITTSASRAELVLAMEAARRAGRGDVARRAAGMILSRLPSGEETSAQLRPYILLSLGVAEYWASDRAGAERDLRLALVEAERQGLDYIRLGCLSQLVGVLTAQNRVNDGAELAEVAAALAHKRGWEGSGWAAELWHALGWITYLRCELKAANEHLERGERSTWHQDALVGAMIPTISALVLKLSGRRAEARAMVDLANARLPEDRSQYVFLDYIDAELARYAVEAGELGRARQLLAGDVAFRSVHHSVAMAELLLAEGQTEAARRALRRGLDEGEGFLDQRLHALALLGSIEPPAVARDILAEALRMASVERIIQPFCQVGAAIMPLIGDIGRSNRTLRPFATEVRERFAELSNAIPAQSEGPGSLTARELEVLRLLDGHDTMAEVAARIHVSTNTLKVHTRHVYDKLGATSRREALAEATRRGLL